MLTALTAQNTRGVTAVHTPPPEFVGAQIAAVFDDLEVAAVKTGMLANAGIIKTVADAMDTRPGLPLVVDPVMVATSGDRLLDVDAVEILKSRLLPRATLVTPNIAETAALLDEGEARTLAEAVGQARRLIEAGCQAVLVKGGHLGGSRATDVLVRSDGTTLDIDAPRLTTGNTHGTGCTLSAAIAALLASGSQLEAAVRGGKSYLAQALEHGAGLRIGHGHGPVDHLFAIKQLPRIV